MVKQSQAVQTVIQSRITEKVLCTLEDRPPVPAEIESINRPIVQSALRNAGWAPFHYPRNVDGIAEPWRATVLWNHEARALSSHLSNTLQITSKEPQLAAACSALVIITWLPEPAPTSLGQSDDPAVIRNEEHLAASSAMVQNFLLELTAHGFGNYWSSGGKLRSPELFKYMGIPTEERLLAAIFIEYPEMRMQSPDTTTRKRGAHRKKRCQDWIRTCALS